MKIYFPAITFQGSPIVWELNEENHQATCLLSCIKKMPSQPQIPLEIFKEFPDIIIEDGAVIIKDIRTFNTTYQSLDVINELKDQITSERSKERLLKRDSSFFKYKKTNLQEVYLSTPSKTHNITLDISSFYNRIILDELIKKDDTDATLWGDTVAYESYFEQKTSSDAKSRKAKFLKSEMSLHIMVQYEKNNRLYPLKSMLIKEIRALLDVLDPVYTDWCSQDGSSVFDKKSVVHYFQDAVLEAMLNSRINNKATEFETPESTSLSPALQKYAVIKARALRAELMLMKFNILINPELPIELALEEKTLNNLLTPISTLRKHITKQPQEVIENIKQKLKGMADLIIQAGIIEESNAQLSTRLNHDLQINVPVVMNFYSFRSLLQTQLELQITGSRKALIPDIIAWS